MFLPVLVSFHSLFCFSKNRVRIELDSAITMKTPGIPFFNQLLCINRKYHNIQNRGILACSIFKLLVFCYFTRSCWNRKSILIFHLWHIKQQMPALGQKIVLLNVVETAEIWIYQHRVLMHVTALWYLLGLIGNGPKAQGILKTVPCGYTGFGCIIGNPMITHTHTH